jgi:hypothetical protein
VGVQLLDSLAVGLRASNDLDVDDLEVFLPELDVADGALRVGGGRRREDETGDDEDDRRQAESEDRGDAKCVIDRRGQSWASGPKRAGG